MVPDPYPQFQIIVYHFFYYLMDAKNLKRFFSFHKYLVVLKHCFINIGDACLCFISLTQPFNDKIK